MTLGAAAMSPSAPAAQSPAADLRQPVPRRQHPLSGGGTVALGAAATVTLGAGGTVTLGAGGNVTLGAGGTVALGQLAATSRSAAAEPLRSAAGGNITLGSRRRNHHRVDLRNRQLDRSPTVFTTETPMPRQVVIVNWNAPAFGVVQTYTIYRSSNGATPIEIGSVSGVNGNPPATTFTDTNPDLTSQTVVYTISTTLRSGVTIVRATPESPSPPAVLKNDQTISLGSLPSSVTISSSPPRSRRLPESNGVANGLQVSFVATGSCSIGSQSIANGVSSASVVLNSTGSCTITASQTGSSTFNAASPVSGTFTIMSAGLQHESQTITFPQLPNVRYGGTFSLSASSSSGSGGHLLDVRAMPPSGATTGVGRVHHHRVGAGKQHL